MSEFSEVQRLLEPEHNLTGIDFDCPECETATESAYIDRQEQTVSWRCTGCNTYIVLEDIPL